MRVIETKPSAVGQQHATIIRENVGAAAGFIKSHVANGAGAATGYVAGFLKGLLGSTKVEGHLDPKPF